MKKNNLLKEKQCLGQEYEYLENQNRRLETVIECERKIEENTKREGEINKKILEINVKLLKNDEEENS